MKKALGTYDIAAICQVTPTTVGRWLDEGKLPYFTTGGGHRRVWSPDLANFLKAHNIPIPADLRSEPPLRILIVDDDPHVLKLLRAAVKEFYPAAEVHEAADGFAAGQKTIGLIPALVILDLRLPGIDGYKVCRAIRQDPRLKDVKVLAVTGYHLEEARAKALEAGADDFLAKPITLDALSKKLETLLAINDSVS
jgi:CheY-like chemotaxis protein